MTMTEPAPMVGIPFVIPFLTATNMPTGDGRIFRAYDLAPMPIPFRIQMSDAPAHDGAVSSGRITAVTANEDGSYSALGVFDITETGVEAARLAATGSMPGVSVEMDEFEAEVLDDGTLDVSHARIRGATQLAIPAFVEAYVMCDLADVETAAAQLAGTPEEAPSGVTVTIAADGAPARAPSEWFADPAFGTNPTDDPRLQPILDRSGRVAGFGCPLTVTAAGQVLGHLAAWGTCHIGYTDVCVNPPHSEHDYAYFNIGEYACSDGVRVACGSLTLATGHADKNYGGRAAAAHYDDTGTVVARVRAGEDAHGIWLAGTVKAGTTAAQIEDMMAAPPSGDWRREGGSLELVAALHVNTPGFPIPRPSMLVADGQCQTLVAAGVLAPTADPIVSRLEALEAAAFGPARADAAVRTIGADAALIDMGLTWPPHG